MSRDRIGAAAVVVLEVLLYVQYTRLDGEFHYWLHGLIGGAVGLGASTAARLRGRRGLTGWEAGVLGHLYSAAPDILFLTADLPHARWMDVFAFHVGAHFVSAPVLTALALFLLALAGYALVTSRRAGPARAAAAPLAAAMVIAAVAVATAAPVPTDVEDLRADPRLAWHHPPAPSTGPTAWTGVRTHRSRELTLSQGQGRSVVVRGTCRGAARTGRISSVDREEILRRVRRLRAPASTPWPAGRDPRAAGRDRLRRAARRDRRGAARFRTTRHAGRNPGMNGAQEGTGDLTGPRTPVDTGDGADPAPARRPVVRTVWVRLVALAVLVAAGAVVAVVVGLPDPEQLRADIAAAGPVAPVLFVLVYAVATLAPLPKNVFAALAGLLFGVVGGVVVVLLAALIGAVAAFWLGRLLGRDAVERFTGARVARVDALLRRRGLLAVLGVRLVPVLPFTAINYAAGLTAVRTRDYLVGTALGIIPGTVAYVALGAYGTTPGSWPFVVAVLVLVALSAGGAALARRSHRYRRRAGAAGEDLGAGAGPRTDP